MCGIVGYLGRKSVVPLLISSLKQLEYRGYDSSGVAFLDDAHMLQVYKASGKLLNLENILPASLSKPSVPQVENLQENGVHIGIGHIRWATHGAATDANAHPHVGENDLVALVHNGIIENYSELKRDLQAQGIQFQSETDTECVAHLLETLSEKAIARGETDFIQVLQEALPYLEGAYALTVIHRNHPDRLYAIRNHAPLVVGVGEGEHWVASDSVAVAEYTNRIIYLKDMEIVEISPEGVRLLSPHGEPITPVIETLQTGPLTIDKKGFKHFMLKEIYEQPDVVRNSLSGRLLGSQEPVQLAATSKIHTLTDAVLSDILKGINRLVIVGCGSSFNAGLVGKYFIESLVRIPVEVEAAGEYRYRELILDKNTLVVAISQSGETADTLEAVRQAQQLGAKTLAVTNREDSTMARETDLVLAVRAGVEVSVCATKSFLAQITVLYLLGLHMAELRGTASKELLHTLKQDLLRAPALIEAALSDTAPVQAVAKQYGSARDVLFMGRGINYPVALEGALKLKEISYIHAEGYSGSELKHGPIAMLDASIPVVSVLVPGKLFDKMISNCQEAKARDARMIGIVGMPPADSDGAGWTGTFDSLLNVPTTHELLSPLLTSIPLQLLAYYMAEYLGKDVDQPRNLAKSVTVE